jgi:hypothetical protein
MCPEVNYCFPLPSGLLYGHNMYNPGDSTLEYDVVCFGREASPSRKSLFLDLHCVSVHVVIDLHCVSMHVVIDLRCVSVHVVPLLLSTLKL